MRYLAKLHDLGWDSALCDAAAFYGKLQLLQWLRECGCQWDERNVLRNAVGSGRLDMLKWLQEATVPWSNGLKKSLLWTAGHRSYLEVVQWLHAQGTPWPKKLYGTAEYSNKPVAVCWTAQVVKRALAHGCTWGDWQCQQLQAERYPEGFCRDMAVELRGHTAMAVHVLVMHWQALNK
jgi:hypothetical protein